MLAAFPLRSLRFQRVSPWALNRLCASLTFEDGIVSYNIARLGNPVCSSNTDIARIAVADPPLPTTVSSEIRSLSPVPPVRVLAVAAQHISRRLLERSNQSNNQPQVYIFDSSLAHHTKTYIVIAE